MRAINASCILNLLSSRHARDVAVAECPLEPWGGLRADLWALRPSWTKPLVSIYEIKVSRQDFLRDEKWVNYLPYCNVFSFAAAPGVIDPSELPEGVGLLEATKTGNMMRTVRKPHWRQDDHEALSRVLKAVLMNRFWQRGGMVMADAAPDSREVRIARWRSDLAEGKVVGRLVRGWIADEMRSCRHERDKALEQVKTYEAFRAELEQRGLRTDVPSWRAWQEISSHTKDHLADRLRDAHTAIASALTELEANGGGQSEVRP